jgi:hypothetical protein
LLLPRAQLQEAERALFAEGRVADEGLDPYDDRYYRQWMHEVPPLRHRNTCHTLSAGANAPTFKLLTTATEHQQRALALIQDPGHPTVVRKLNLNTAVAAPPGPVFSTLACGYVDLGDSPNG